MRNSPLAGVGLKKGLGVWTLFLHSHSSIDFLYEPILLRISIWQTSKSICRFLTIMFDGNRKGASFASIDIWHCKNIKGEVSDSPVLDFIWLILQAQKWIFVVESLRRNISITFISQRANHATKLLLWLLILLRNRSLNEFWTFHRYMLLGILCTLYYNNAIEVFDIVTTKRNSNSNKPQYIK